MFDALVLIPAYNEQDTIAATVTGAHQLDGVREVIVIDDGSSDKTRELAEAAGAQTISLPENRGKGEALMAGIQAISDPPSAVLFLDGDLGRSARNCGVLIRAVQRSCDVAIADLSGNRFSGGFGFAVRLARVGIWLFTGKMMHTPLSGQRAFTWQALQAALPLSGGFGVEVSSTVRVLRAGLEVKEIPVSLTHRRTGRNIPGFLHRGRQFTAVLRTFLQILFGGNMVCR